MCLFAQDSPKDLPFSKRSSDLLATTSVTRMPALGLTDPGDFVLKFSHQWLLISERRRETRREASPPSTQRASCDSHMEKQNNIITREVLILATWFIELRFIIFRCETDISDEPARPEPAMTLFGDLFLKCVERITNSKILHYRDTGLKIFVSIFDKDFFF